MSGAMFLSGDGKVPTRMNAPYVDFGTALLNTVGVLAALMERAKSGKGQKVETALLRTAVNITNGHLIEQAMLNINRIATLNRGFTAGPSDTYKCQDGWIYAMTIGQPLFGDGVLRASLRKIRKFLKDKPPATRASSKAVRRAGIHDNTSSARAAHLPAHSQFFPL